MELSINNCTEIHFECENTKRKLGIRIWGDRKSFAGLHELLSECWDCESIDMSRAEMCSYIGVISFFSYEVRHTFMGDCLVTLDGKAVKNWDDDMFRLFESEQDRFKVGLELSWPYMLFIMAAWWECLRHQDCPSRVWAVARELTEHIERLLLKLSKTQYPAIEPFIHGAIFAASPYLMHIMMHVHIDYLLISRFSKMSPKRLSGLLETAAYGTYRYDDLQNQLKREAKRLGCSIEDLHENVEDWVYDVEL